MFCLCFVCVSHVFFYVCQNPKILFSQDKILDFCLTQVLRKQNICQTYVKHVGDISFTLAAGLYQVWISNWQLFDTGGTANSCFTYVANFTHMFCFMCHLCFNYIPFMFRLYSIYVLSYVWHMLYIRFTYVSFICHIFFYLRLDIVYIYVMPRPPSIETIPGAPLDQAKLYYIFTPSHLLIYIFTPSLHTLTPADLDLHTFTSADLDLHTFTSADLDLHSLTPADLDLHTLTPADLDLHTLTSADLDLHTLTPADLDLHTFTSADLDLHTLTSADLDLHTFTPADLDLHTLTPADLDLHTLTSADLDLHTLTSADLHLHTLTSADLHLHPSRLQI